MANIDDIGVPKREGGNYSTVGNVLTEFAAYIVLESQKKLKEKKAIASHKLIQSIRPELSVYGFKIYMEDYFQWVDEGRPAGKQPPIESIIKWINTKPDLKAKIGLTRKGIKNLGKPKASTLLKQAAFLIARKIGREGTKPTNFFSEVMNQDISDRFKKRFIEALKVDVPFNIKVIVDTKSKLATGEKRF